MSKAENQVFEAPIGDSTGEVQVSLPLLVNIKRTMVCHLTVTICQCFQLKLRTTSLNFFGAFKQVLESDDG